MPDTTYELSPITGITVTHFLVSADTKKAVDFYSRILGGKVVMDGENGKPNVVQFANTWVIINVGGGPSDAFTPAEFRGGDLQGRRTTISISTLISGL